MNLSFSMFKKLATLLIFLLSGTASALNIGDQAPDFSLTDQNGQTKSLKENLGKWVILYFYPMDDTPGCTTEACSFRDASDKILAKKAVVYGVSVDDVESHKKFTEKYSLPFSLLADVDGNVAKSYNSLGEFLSWKVALRNTYIIDPSGKVAKKYIGVDPSIHVQQVLQDLVKLQS